jgi:hypothetical protein
VNLIYQCFQVFAIKDGREFNIKMKRGYFIQDVIVLFFGELMLTTKLRRASGLIWCVRT